MPVTEQMKNQKLRNGLMLGAVLLVFLVPLVLAWYMAGHKRNGGGAEHGILINPPRELENRDLLDPAAGLKTSLYGKWTMFALIEEDCGQDCAEVLYRMRQIHIAMGEKYFRVQRAVYFSGQDAENHAKNSFSGYAGQLILARAKAGTNFRKNFQMDGKNPGYAIYLIDPRGFLMMCYPKDTNPSGIIKDLKHLLKTTG